MGAETQSCTIGFSHTPYRLVRASFLRRFDPTHPTEICEPLHTRVDKIGSLSSSECVKLTWRFGHQEATHAELFWIVEVDEDDDMCDLLIADRPPGGQEGMFYQ
jgi:hypothetical protein